MGTDFPPILVVPAVPIKSGIRFLKSDKQLDVMGPIAETVWRILAQCNGYNTPDQITEYAELDKGTVDDVLSDLTKIQVVLDSREIFRHFHYVSNNPAHYSRDMTAIDVARWQASPHIPVKSGEVFQFHTKQHSRLMDLQSKRRSVRSFSNAKLSRDQVGQIC